MALTPLEFAKLKNTLATKKPEVKSDDFGGSSGVGGVALGAAKSLIGGTRDTAQLLQGVGQRALAAIDPTQNFEEVRQNTGFESLDDNSVSGAAVKEILAPKGSAEKAGAAAEIAAEFLIPATLATKTRGAATIINRAKGSIPTFRGATGAIQDAVTPLEKGVQSVLNPTTLIPKEALKNVPIENIVAQSVDKGKKLELYLKQAQKAVNDFSQPTPLEIAGQRAEQALNVLNNKLTKQGQLKQEALGKIGDKLVGNVGFFRNKLATDLTERVGINVDRVTGEIIPVRGRASKISLDPADNKMVRDIYNSLLQLGQKPTVRQVDDTIDAIQDILYKRKSTLAVPINGQVEGILKNVTGELNKAIKKIAGEQYTKANDKFSYFIDYRDKLNKALGVDATKGGALMKRVFSPSDGGTKELFNKVKDLTGIDLIEDATLAKFVMENVGDARQASILEELIKGQLPNKRSFIEFAAQQTIGRLQNPVEKARRVVQKLPK